MKIPAQYNKDLLLKIPQEDRDMCIVALLGVQAGILCIQFSRLYNICAKVGLLSYHPSASWEKTYQFTDLTFSQEHGDNGWIKIWRAEWKHYNPDRMGQLAECKRRWGHVKVQFPELTPMLMTTARDLHFQHTTNPQFIIKSHKFIWRKVGRTGAIEYPARDILIRHGYINE